MAASGFLRHQRTPALALLSTGVLCPCHVLVGAIGLLTGGTVLSPAAQDGVHAVYVPLAVLSGAWLLRRSSRHRDVSPEGSHR